MNGIIETLNHADPGSGAFLSAVEWLCSRGEWELCDELLGKRVETVVAEQARRAVLPVGPIGGKRGEEQPWRGPQNKERAA